MKICPLIKMKMPTIVVIFIHVSRQNFMFSWVEHEKKFYNLSSRSDLYMYEHFFPVRDLYMYEHFFLSE